MTELLTIAQVVLLRDPLRVDAVETADLPPALATDNALEVLRAEPFDQSVGGLVAGVEGDLDRSDGGPVGGGDVGVGAVE